MYNGSFISAKQITSKFDITSGTIRRWAEDGRIRFIKPNGIKRLYNVDDINRIFSNSSDDSTIKQRKSVCYARVSSGHQREDLERQITLLSSKFPERKIFKDIASGLNWNRPGFNSLLDEVYKGDIEEIVVTYKDRLCRFGFELVEWILKKHNVKLVVLNSNDGLSDPSIELSEDLLAITTVFVAKNNGIRASKYRKERQFKEEKTKN
jgi:predicted site-specific integrase-resolvase